MKYVYVSPALPEDVFGKVLGYGKGSPGQQAQKYNKLLANGIAQNNRDILMLSAPPVPPGSRFFKTTKIEPCEDSGISYKFLKVLDVPVIKNVYTFLQAKKEIRRIAKAAPRDVCVVCDLLTLSASLGALKAAEKLGVRSCGIVTDLPEYLAGKPSGKRYARLYKKAVSLCGSFVLLTEQMAGALPTGGRPYTVIEGISTPAAAKPLKQAARTGSNRYIFYAGGIEKAYGVEKLVRAFLAADISGCELLLCGSGSYADELSDIAAKNGSVKYIGVLPNEKVMELEAGAALLVNPRTSEGAFTAYSFPSKNIEYLSTGRPVLAYMLPGIPEEYRDFFITPSDESCEALALKLKETLGAPASELEAFGERAAEFARVKKSPSSQAARLIEIIENLGEKS